MVFLWSLLIAFWKYLPWVAIAMMAALALRRRHDSKSLLMQAAGASALFVLGIVQWMFFWLFSGAPRVLTGAGYVFDFLFFVALSVFALGYCVERFRRPREQGYPVEVTATPVDK